MQQSPHDHPLEGVVTLPLQASRASVGRSRARAGTSTTWGRPCAALAAPFGQRLGCPSPECVPGNPGSRKAVFVVDGDERTPEWRRRHQLRALPTPLHSAQREVAIFTVATSSCSFTRSGAAPTASQNTCVNHSPNTIAPKPVTIRRIPNGISHHRPEGVGFAWPDPLDPTSFQNASFTLCRTLVRRSPRAPHTETGTSLPCFPFCHLQLTLMIQREFSDRAKPW
jgi:hypothetical protein